MAVVLAIANQKGGVAKTTTAVNLAHALVSRGKRVLAIDVDPQASLTIYFGQDPRQLEERQQTLYYALLRDKALSSIVIDGNPALVPSSITLSQADAELMAAWSSASVLREKLNGVVEAYDYALLDCPPTLTLLTANAIGAAHAVLVPVKTDFLSIMGIPLLLESIEKLRLRQNKELRVLGILPTMFNARLVHDNEALAELKHIADARRIRMFEPINRSTRHDQAAAEGKPAVELAPNAPGVENYYKLADEILACEQR
jgi:chromosome partitioning protein